MLHPGEILTEDELSMKYRHNSDVERENIDA